MKLRKLLIKQNGKLYNFIMYELNSTGDGTMYVNFIRSGNKKRRACFKLSDDLDKFDNIKLPTEDCRSGMEISYHTTGMINYKNVNLQRIYSEPTFNITRVFTFAVISVPCISKLDIACEEELDEDNVFEIPDSLGGRVNFHISIAPYGYYEKEFENLLLAKISYLNLFDIVIHVGENIKIPEKLSEHFVYTAPPIGMFNKQFIDKDTACIAFHKKISNGAENIIYQPNSEGVWKIIHSVPMRIPPILTIKFVDPSYSAVKIEEQSTIAVTKFIVKNKHGQKIKNVVDIQSIELDSEID